MLVSLIYSTGPLLKEVPRLAGVQPLWYDRTRVELLEGYCRTLMCFLTDAMKHSISSRRTVMAHHLHSAAPAVQTGFRW